MGQRKTECRKKQNNRGQCVAEMTPLKKLSVNSLIHKEERWVGCVCLVGGLGAYIVFVSSLRQAICHLQQERSRLPDKPILLLNNTCL